MAMVGRVACGRRIDSVISMVCEEVCLQVEICDLSGLLVVEVERGASGRGSEVMRC